MTDDFELIRNYARRGDVNSLSALVSRHAVWLTALLRGYMRSADVEDAFQDVWMRVARSAGDFHGGSFRAYLAVTARRTVYNRARSERPVQSLDAADPDGNAPIDALPSPNPPPDVQVDRKTTAEAVRAAVQTLQGRMREVLLLRLEAEMTFQEIADELQVPLGTVLTWMQKAKAELKEKLGGLYGR